MKIITENAVYVTFEDIALLHELDTPIPAAIHTKVCQNGSFIVGKNNRFNFFKFDTEEEIEFFRSQDWIIDYDDVKDLADDEIIALGKSIIEEKNAIASKYKAMNPEERSLNSNMKTAYDLLNHKMYSLRDFLWYKQGHIKIELPEDITPPSGPKKRTAFQKLIRTIFKKN